MIKITELAPQFKEALPIIQQIEEHGFEAFFVGGSVRDTLLNKSIHDVDIASSAYPEEVKRLFPKTIDVGIDHGTVMVLYQKEAYEITTFRTESTYQDFRRPDSVTFVRSLKEDLKRRDFTINALAMDKSGRIIDYFNGIKDMKAKRIKAVGRASERFHEDALRMMRAVRFVSQLEFDLELETKEAIAENSSLLEKIAVERIQIEFLKMLLGAGRSKGLTYFIDTELYHYCPRLVGKKEGLVHYSNLEGRIYTYEEAWSFLLYFLNIPSNDVHSFLRSWKASNKEIRSAQAIYTSILIREKRLLTNWELYQLGLDNALILEHMMTLLTRDSYEKEIQETFDHLPIQQISELKLNGHDLIQHLEKKPGKWLGILLKQIEVDVVEGRISNEKDRLLEAANDYLEKE